jgi:PAS domain S-box-containing protein
MAALALARAKQPDVPFVLVSGTLGEEKAVDCVLRGATDYVLKQRLDRLVPSVVRALTEAEECRKRREAEEALRDSEVRHRTILATALDGFWLVDMQGRLHDVNAAYSRMSGYSRQELLAMRIFDLEAMESTAETAARIKRIRAHGMDRFESRHRRKDGSVIDVEISVQLQHMDGGRMVVFSHDITERKRTEEALRHAHARLRCFVDANLVGVVIASPAGGIIEANEYYLRTIGYSREELEQGQIDWRAITPPEWLATDEYAIGELRERGSCTPYEKEYVRRDGSRVSVYLSNALLPGPEEQIAAFVLDITDRKRLEAQLRQQQKLEALGTLASGVAHEINNPINGIMNYAQLITDTAEPKSQTAEYAGEITHETERVATIVRNLLQFARQETQSHSPARIQDIVEQTLSLVRAVLQHDQITLTVDVPADLPLLKCRSQQIQQVVMNLLTNARDALNEKYPGYHEAKTLAVRAALFEQGGCPWLRLTVADQGCGIPPEIQARIFDPFFTTKPRDKGTGLGLSISHGIVKDHHGVLHFETKPGIGTQFHLDLPVEEE